MWNFKSSRTAGDAHSTYGFQRPTLAISECSDDEGSSNTSREEGLECPICWESFNIVENVPYVLWCGHTLCKNCILGLRWAVIKVPTLPIQLPLLISCPWCNAFSFRLMYKGSLKFPRKNFFLLWMVESMNGDRLRSSSSPTCGNRLPVWPLASNSAAGNQASRRQLVRCHDRVVPNDDTHSHERVYNHNYRAGEWLHSSIRKLLVFFINATAKFPLVIIFLLIILYAVPASAAILVLYVLVTILFALPSFLVLYFAYPSLDWLVREIIT